MNILCIYVCNIIIIDCFIVDKHNSYVRTHFNKKVSNRVDIANKLTKLNSKNEENNEQGESDQKPVESYPTWEDDDELVEFFINPEHVDESSGTKIKISRRLWKIINGLLVYRAKHGNYRVETDFIFEKDEEGYLSEYKLGRKLNLLLRLLYTQKKNKRVYDKIRDELKRENDDFFEIDLKEAPKLLWLLGFPVKTYFEESKLHKKTSKEDAISSKMAKMSKTSLFRRKNEGYGKYPSQQVCERVELGKKNILEYLFEHKQYLKDSMTFKNPQQFPEPTNKTSPIEELIRKIVGEILSKNKATCPLVKRDTRNETEGGYHYAFFHWSFEQVLQALVMFNEMYFDYNKELLVSSEKSGEEFKPITFNIIKKSYRIPESEDWPKEFHGMPLGLFIEKFRNGDIDAKEHWLRRPLLDHIGFNWGDGIKYLNFTWDKLELGLIWFINFRGFPIEDIPPGLIIPKTTMVAKFGKPEEIQGLKLGRLFYSAIDQIQVINKHYPERFEFICDMALDVIDRVQMNLGYRPVPHSKTNKVDSTLLVSPDQRYLFDDFNEPPKIMEKDVITILDIEDL